MLLLHRSLISEDKFLANLKKHLDSGFSFWDRYGYPRGGVTTPDIILLLLAFHEKIPEAYSNKEKSRKEKTHMIP